MTGWRSGLLVGVAWALALGCLRWHDARATFDARLGPPPTVVLRGLVTGFDNVVADALYLQFVQHFGRCLARRTALRDGLPWLLQITALDPRFEGAYVVGSMALGNAGEIEALEQFWQGALRQWPSRSELAYDAGMHLFLFGDRPDQYLRAAALFHRAAELPGARPECRAMEARMYQVTGRRELAIAIWRATLQTSASKEARAVAARTLRAWGVPPEAPRSR
ncbi:MAG: hypothetical protein VKS61_12670 [Candidatus Sericytochromatia bacterium]|nr:hypothetical protein [Candidatus Sericytochromatia bacterium]